MKGKIGIFMHGQNGDIMSAMSVLKYRDLLWPDKDLVWFVNKPNSDALYGHDIEIRPFAHGWGYPDRCSPHSADNINAREKGLPAWEDWSCLKKDNGKLCQKSKLRFELTKDLEDGYFPAPYHIEAKNRHNVDYPNVSRMVFGADPSWEWHPMLNFSMEERVEADNFWHCLCPGRKNIIIETFAGSGQSLLTHGMVMRTLDMCIEKWGPCNFIFCSNKYLREMPEFPREINSRDDIYHINAYTVRQCTLIADFCDLFIGVSSGISVSSSCWGSKPVPKIQYCGSFICSTVSLANGPIHLVTTDGNKYCEDQYYDTLKSCLQQYK